VIAGKPICTAMVPCDHIHADPETGKYYVLGTFPVVHAGSSPYPAIMLYMEFTNGHGSGILHVELLSPDEQEHVAECETPLRFLGPMDFVVGKLRFENLYFSQSGEYRFRASIDGKHVMDRVLPVLLKGDDEHGSEPEA